MCSMPAQFYRYRRADRRGVHAFVQLEKGLQNARFRYLAICAHDSTVAGIVICRGSAPVPSIRAVSPHA